MLCLIQYAVGSISTGSHPTPPTSPLPVVEERIRVVHDRLVDYAKKQPFLSSLGFFYLLVGLARMFHSYIYNNNKKLNPASHQSIHRLDIDSLIESGLFQLTSGGHSFRNS